MDCTKIIGEKIKALRTAQEITLEELAERTGLSKEQIESIEQNINIPSLAPLVKIARALGVRLGTFLDDQPNENGPVVCRCGEADDTISFSNNSPDARQNLHYHSLSRSKTDRHMEPFVIDIDPNPENGFTLPHTKEKNSSWCWKEFWKSITENRSMYLRKAIQSIMTPSYLTMYMLLKDSLPAFWPSSILPSKETDYDAIIRTYFGRLA